MQSRFFLLPVLVYLTCAELSDTDDNQFVPADSTSAPVLVAEGADDPSTGILRGLNGLIELPRGFFQGSYSNEDPAPKAPSTQDSTPTPEDEPDPVTKPDCSIDGELYYTAVCCLDDPIPLVGRLILPFTYFTLRRCSACNSNFLFSLSFDVESFNEIIPVIEKHVLIFNEFIANQRFFQLVGAIIRVRVATRGRDGAAFILG